MHRFGDWQTTTFVAGLRVHQLTAPMVAYGPMDGELLDTLSPTECENYFASFGYVNT